jgi:plasmid replication initiation protein
MGITSFCMIPDNKLLLKNKCLIHVSGEGTLVQKKLFNILLYLCFNELKEQNKFKKPIQEIIELLGYSEDLNYTRLYNDLKALMRVVISWNIVGLNKKNWVMGASTLLSFIKIEEGFVTYEFSSGLQEKLLENKAYTKINLGVQNVFTSKYSLILYEFCKDYYRASDLQGESPWVSIQEIRHLMGVTDGDYEMFKDFNKWILKQALKEINSKTDIAVSMEFQTIKRKITHIKFLVTPNISNPEIHSFNLKKDPMLAFQTVDTTGVNVSSTTPSPHLQSLHLSLLSQTSTFGISDTLATSWLNNHSPEYIQSKIDLTYSYIKQKKIKTSPSGFLIRAIQEDFGGKITDIDNLLSQEALEARRINPETFSLVPTDYSSQEEFEARIIELESQYYNPRWSEMDMNIAKELWKLQQVPA